MKTSLDLERPWRMRGCGLFHVCFLGYLTWHADSLSALLVGCGMLAAVLIEAGKYEWVLWRLRQLRGEPT